MVSLPSPYLVLALSVVLRVFLLFYGLYQDAHSPLKYTDIDYNVFTSASAYVARGLSPYLRETYRYTPMLAWILLPTTWGGAWFSFGKVIFALSDIVAGWLIALILQDPKGGGMDKTRAMKYASIWLLNPMVATISTRGSSEGLLGVMVIGVLWAVFKGRVVMAGVLLGLSVHFKIYPFIYGVSILWWLDTENSSDANTSWAKKIQEFLNQQRLVFVTSSLITFAALNGIMYYIYGFDFLQHTYLHHVTRIDHRHNFSPYNTLLYLASSPASTSTWHLESLAFLPQLFLSAFAIPLALAKQDLASTMMAQTFAFVCFNKVCTSQVSSAHPSSHPPIYSHPSLPPSFFPSRTRTDRPRQYFLWYMIFLPFYLPGSSLLQNPVLGATLGGLWVVSQVHLPSRTAETRANASSVRRVCGYSKPMDSNSWARATLCLAYGFRVSTFSPSTLHCWVSSLMILQSGVDRHREE
jgi:phosphatidylinositol glycan class M